MTEMGKWDDVHQNLSLRDASGGKKWNKLFLQQHEPKVLHIFNLVVLTGELSFGSLQTEKPYLRGHRLHVEICFCNVGR